MEQEERWNILGICLVIPMKYSKIVYKYEVINHSQYLEINKALLVLNSSYTCNLKSKILSHCFYPEIPVTYFQASELFQP